MDILGGCRAYLERDLFKCGLKASGTLWGLVSSEPFWRGHLRGRRTFYKEGELIRGWSLSNRFSCHFGNYKLIFIFSHKLPFIAAFHAI